MLFSLGQEVNEIHHLSDLVRLKVLELVQDGLSCALIYFLFYTLSLSHTLPCRTHRIYLFNTSLIAMTFHVNRGD